MRIVFDLDDTIQFASFRDYVNAIPHTAIIKKMRDEVKFSSIDELQEKLLQDKKNTEEFLTSFIGREMEVLFEQTDKDGYYEGKTGNYITVLVKSDEDLCERFKNVVIKEIKDGKAYGEVIL